MEDEEHIEEFEKQILDLAKLTNIFSVPRETRDFVVLIKILPGKTVGNGTSTNCVIPLFMF